MSPTPHAPDALGCLPMACRCETEIRPVPLADIRAGIGWKCCPQCSPPTPKDPTP